MAFQKTFSIPKGYEATLTADEFLTVGLYGRVAQPGSGTQYAPSEILAEASAVVGPFNEDRDYFLMGDNGDIAYELAYSGIYTQDDTSEAVFDAVGTMFTGNTETGITVTYQDADNTVDFVISDEYIQDTVGAMVSSNTESGIAVSYQDADGTLDFVLDQLPSQNSGIAATGVTAAEYGDGHQHTTVLTVDTVLPAIAGGADLSVGVLLYTLPAGAVIVDKAYMSMAITQTEGHITADTPDVGLGTTIAAGANALLSDTSGAENILTGQTADDCDGTAEVKTVANQILVIEAAGDHTVYFNAADGWAASGDAAALLEGTVVLHWQFMA